MKIWKVRFGEETKDGCCSDERRFSGNSLFEVIEKAKAWVAKEKLSNEALKRHFEGYKKEMNDDEWTLEEYAESEKESWEITSVVLDDNLDDVE